MLNIGCHLSASKGFLAMGQEALKIKANTFQFFTRNPRGGKAKEMDPEDAQGLMELLKEHNFAQILAHAPYTLNPCSTKPEVREFAHEIMADDLNRMEFTPHNLYNFHPGSHTTQTKETGIEQIIALLNTILKPQQSTIVLLETMSGKGSEIGATFEELAKIIDGVELKEKMGICLDTCHVFDGGYDIVNDLDGVLEKFETTIGINRLYAIHLNDSMNEFQSHKDRHQKIGEGKIGIKAFESIINHPQLKNLPFYLETPNELSGYAAEIKLLRNLYK
ncbi:MAG: deoxyribonuclease IV [Clostridiales bacterium]